MPWYSFFLWELQNFDNDLELTFVPKQRMSWSNGSNLKKIGRKGIPRFTVQPKCNITYKNYPLIMTLICKWNSVYRVLITIDILYFAFHRDISHEDEKLFSCLLLTPFTFTTSFIIDDLDFQDIFLVIVCRRVMKSNARFNGLGCQGWCRDCVWFIHKFMSSKEWRWNLFIMGKSFKCDLTLICYSYLYHLPIFQ